MTMVTGDLVAFAIIGTLTVGFEDHRVTVPGAERQHPQDAPGVDRLTVALADRGGLAANGRLTAAVEDVIDLAHARMPVQPL